MFKKTNNGNLILPSSTTTTQAEKILPYELKQVKKVLAELSWVCLTYKTKDLFCRINENKLISFSFAYVKESCLLKYRFPRLLSNEMVWEELEVSVQCALKVLVPIMHC